MNRLYVPDKYRRQRAIDAVNRDQAQLCNIVARAFYKQHGNEWVKATVVMELGWEAPSDILINEIRETIKAAEEKFPEKMEKIRKQLKLT